MTTLATALLTGLKEHGAREIFGIPGDFVLPFFKTIEESNILPYFTLSHEPAVGFAADAASIGIGNFVECFQRRLHTSKPTRTTAPRTNQVVGLTVASQEPTVSVER